MRSKVLHEISLTLIFKFQQHIISAHQGLYSEITCNSWHVQIGSLTICDKDHPRKLMNKYVPGYYHLQVYSREII
jgi:hypothetical protein